MYTHAHTKNAHTYTNTRTLSCVRVPDLLLLLDISLAEDDVDTIS